MPYVREISIDQFMPDENFDAAEDLIRIELEDQELFVSNIATGWVVSCDDPTASGHMHEMYDAVKGNFPGAEKFRLDAARIGSHALMSVDGWGWRGIWKSEKPVTSIEPVCRTPLGLAISSIVLFENR